MQSGPGFGRFSDCDSSAVRDLREDQVILLLGEDLVVQQFLQDLPFHSALLLTVKTILALVG